MCLLSQFLYSFFNPHHFSYFFHLFFSLISSSSVQRLTRAHWMMIVSPSYFFGTFTHHTPIEVSFPSNSCWELVFLTLDKECSGQRSWLQSLSDLRLDYLFLCTTRFFAFFHLDLYLLVIRRKKSVIYWMRISSHYDLWFSFSKSQPLSSRDSMKPSRVKKKSDYQQKENWLDNWVGPLNEKDWILFSPFLLDTLSISVTYMPTFYYHR